MRNEALEFPFSQITLSAAQVNYPNIKVGDIISEVIDWIVFNDTRLKSPSILITRMG